MSLYVEICLQCTLSLLGMSVNLPLSLPSLWSFRDMTNTWRIHKACQILFGCLNPVADLVFWSLSAWQCISLTGLLQQGSLMWEWYCIRRGGHWRMEIYWLGNQWLSCQADACSSHLLSQCYWKDLIVFDYYLGHFYPWKTFCTVMCVSFRAVFFFLYYWQK